MVLYEYRVLVSDEVGYYDEEDDQQQQQQQQQQQKPRPTDLLRPYISVCYELLSPPSLDLSRIVRRYFHPPTITCQSFFGQEGEDYLLTHLSQLHFFTSERIHGMISGIRYMVQQAFGIDDMSNVAHNIVEPSNTEPPREVPFYLEFEFDVMLDNLGVEESVPHVGMVPASEEAMQTLLKKPKAVKREQPCAICMEGFDVDGGDHGGMEGVLAMPCDHVFHRRCIVKWLQASHVCPLCRYAMPTASDEAKI